VSSPKARTGWWLKFDRQNSSIRNNHHPGAVVANELEQVGTQDQTNFFGDGPWFCIGLRVIDRDLDFHGSEVFTPVPLGDMQRFGRGFASLIQPCP